jgi:hypothetical protein
MQGIRPDFSAFGRVRIGLVGPYSCPPGWAIDADPPEAKRGTMSQYGEPPQGPTNPPPPSSPYGSTPNGPYGGQQPKKGFFGALFDFSFSTFITPMIVKAVYILSVIVLVLVWLVWLVAAFTQSAGLGLVVLILGPVGMIIYLAFIRMTLEFYLAIVRMSEDIHRRLPGG